MTILEVHNLKKIYTTRFGGNPVQALSQVSFSVEEGEYVAIMEMCIRDRYEARRRTEREKRAAWRDMAREDLTVWLRTRIRLLKTKTDSLQQWRFSQRRLLRAFPHLKEIQDRLNSSSQALDEEVTNDEERHSV